MNLQFNINSFYAVGKHVVSFASGAVALAVTWHFLTPTDAASINENVNHVVTGFNELAKGLAGLSATGMVFYNAWRAAHNASPLGQAEALTKALPGTVIVGSDELAKATPANPNVMSRAEVKVVSK